MERQLASTAVTENVGLAGTTCTVVLPSYKTDVEVEYDPTSNRLRVLIRGGDFEWSSEWLECESPSPITDMVRHIQGALRHLQLLTSSRSSGQKNGLTPLELITLTLSNLEWLLA